MTEWESCPKCGSTEVLTDVRPVDRSDSGIHDLSIGFAGARIVGPFRMTKMVPLKASVCAQCGYVELYSKDTLQVRQVRDGLSHDRLSAGQERSTPVVETSSGTRTFLLLAISLALFAALAVAALVLVLRVLGPR